MKRWYYISLVTIMVASVLCEVLPSYVLLAVMANAALCGIQMEVMRKRTFNEFQHKLKKGRKKEGRKEEIFISEEEYSEFAEAYYASHKEA